MVTKDVSAWMSCCISVLVKADMVDAKEEAKLVVSTVLDCMVTVEGWKVNMYVCEKEGGKETA